MQDRVFYSISFGFVSGILIRSLFSINIFIVILLGVMGMALFLFFTLISKNKWGVIFTIFIIALTFGIFRFNISNKNFPDVFESKVENKIKTEGVIIDEPDIRENNQKLTIEIEQDKEKTKILASVGLEQEYKYGDVIYVTGKLEKPKNFETDQGKVFDYVNYLRKDGIFYVMSYPRVEIVSSGHGNFLKSFLFYIKGKFLEKINLNILSPENLLMGGLILGEKSAFSEELRTSFVNTGTIHIVALSGYNVTIVAEWLMKIFNQIYFLPNNFGIFMGIFSIILFVLMTGASSTAIRAGIMAILVLVARLTGRNYDVGRALILAGVFMIMLNPFVLVYDVSFQLSFIATIAVIFFTPRIEKYFLWLPKTFGLRDIISVTSAAYIFVCPFILYKMGNLSIVALPTNILVLPFIPLTMFFGFLTGIAGVIWDAFAIPFGYIGYVFLHYELWIISFFSSIPFASISIPDFPLIVTLTIYIYFVYMLFGRNIKSFFTSPL
jgi:competence protein ComEC